jgi:hypothetical protein
MRRALFFGIASVWCAVLAAQSVRLPFSHLLQLSLRDPIDLVNASARVADSGRSDSISEGQVVTLERP